MVEKAINQSQTSPFDPLTFLRERHKSHTGRVPEEMGILTNNSLIPYNRELARLVNSEI